VHSGSMTLKSWAKVLERRLRGPEKVRATPKRCLTSRERLARGGREEGRGRRRGKAYGGTGGVDTVC